jgi:hypothetical protein
VGDCALFNIRLSGVWRIVVIWDAGIVSLGCYIYIVVLHSQKDVVDAFSSNTVNAL